MPGPTDERTISLSEILQAAEAHDVGGFVERLATQQNWEAITFLFKMAGTPQTNPRVGLADLTAAAQAFHDVARTRRRGKREAAAADRELRAPRCAAANALLTFTRRPLDSEVDKRAVRLAATLLFAAAEHRRAAGLFEELGDDTHAADAFAALGDIEQMEEALARIERRQHARTTAVDAMRRFETLLGAGERLAAVSAAAAISEGTAEAASARELGHRLDSRLCRGRGVTLRLPDGRSVRFAATPALLGRDPAAEIPLRDPGVSRRHALLARRDGALTIEDAGSRSGVRLGGALVSAALALHGDGELSLGATCTLRFSVDADGAAVLTGGAGLDRALLAVVGDGPLPLDRLLAEAAGLSIGFASGVARLGRAAEVAVRVDGQLIGAGCDLLHGDVIEVRPAGAATTAPTLRFEVI
ncbi:MAG TPA: FHA domain-containing protein [Polyangia bacterium]|jgi:hypothetical protein|nr:FHA domain-containing protein [Polyangia bacterium]